MSFFKQFMEAPFLKKAMYAVLAVMVVLNFLILPAASAFRRGENSRFLGRFRPGRRCGLGPACQGGCAHFSGKRRGLL